MAPVKRIPSTTLCCIDCINGSLAVEALKKSSAWCAFDRVLFLTDRELDLEGIETIQIRALSSVGDYSSFVLQELARYIETDHVLLIQWDGYVLNAEAWTDDFCRYDYIGAVWGQHTDAFRVGNGGFSLRSKKLLVASQNIPAEHERLVEDELICREYRAMLEAKHGILFATEAVAERFSFETTYPTTLPFGFHGLFNMWLVLPPAEVAAFILRLPAHVVASPQFFQLGINYRDLRQYRFAELIFRRMVGLDPGRQDALGALEGLEENRVAAPALSRNERCPCGSGQRYKHCCGREPTIPAARPVTRQEDNLWLLTVARNHRQHGRQAHAAAICRLVLHEDPENPEAMRQMS